jgi:hypothetical protein
LEELHPDVLYNISYNQLKIGLEAAMICFALAAAPC